MHVHATHADQVLRARQDVVDAAHVISRRIQAGAEMEGPPPTSRQWVDFRYLQGSSAAPITWSEIVHLRPQARSNRMSAPASSGSLESIERSAPSAPSAQPSGILSGTAVSEASQAFLIFVTSAPVAPPPSTFDELRLSRPERPRQHLDLKAGSPARNYQGPAFWEECPPMPEGTLRWGPCRPCPRVML